jgi:imidazoleglycerol-phosphate dehydratase
MKSKKSLPARSKGRTASLARKTKETDIMLSLNLDGDGTYSIDSQIPFFSHMLELFSKHSLIDLHVRAKGDIEVDGHHSVEDIGIVFGQAFAKALGDMKSIRRYGTAFAPMDESLSMASVDLCNRPYLVYDVKVRKVKTGNFDAELVKEFFQAFSSNARITLHLRNFYGDNTHHVFESLFKAFALALRQAVSFDDRRKGLPTTKDLL